MKKPSAPTANRRAGAHSKKRQLAVWLERTKPTVIGEHEWDELRAMLGPVSENYLRHLLRTTGVRMDPIVEGVRQETREALESSLLKMAGEYERGDRERQTLVRRLVIAARDHARWATRNPDKEAEKQEMVLWMNTWLENPPLFADWVRLRRTAIRDS